MDYPRRDLSIRALEPWKGAGKSAAKGDSKEHGASSIFPDRAELISLVESLLAP